MTQAAVFMNNRSQAVRLPAEMRFADHVKKVHVRVVGAERILAPADQVWDSFFLSQEGVDEDFMAERAVQHPSTREAL
ncbi:type II toxin-antitoxin system VapB family antitoxin [Ottowia testudinis]|uniref:AbrB/MazE/SpoVT family DNA-binding domain-containing protein n=1 Tax=Ottowia testudinis TaxID=2816950 RepID=A0A975CMC3_9BURK|nr:type II toxin-antitoxin system VapB family antitoxin [Ottowia testudinis]QTD46829.1 AbrB/MazE/SpoVT family DNA-binding domain-containing protein [Ottowia testudinis]